MNIEANQLPGGSDNFFRMAVSIAPAGWSSGSLTSVSRNMMERAWQTAKGVGDQQGCGF
jgi:hypothetical protein